MPTFIHPGLNLSNLSDEEITSKITDLHSRLRYAFSSWHNSQMISQLQNLLDSLVFEQNERLMKEVAAYKAATQKETIESDPEFAHKDIKKEMQQMSKKDDPRKKRQIPIITKNWVSKNTE
jgi:gas vesicle protein